MYILISLVIATVLGVATTLLLHRWIIGAADKEMSTMKKSAERFSEKL